MAAFAAPEMEQEKAAFAAFFFNSTMAEISAGEP
jgi:hypothetical protein